MEVLNIDASALVSNAWHKVFPVYGKLLKDVCQKLGT